MRCIRYTLTKFSCHRLFLIFRRHHGLFEVFASSLYFLRTCPYNFLPIYCVRWSILFSLFSLELVYCRIQRCQRNDKSQLEGSSCRKNSKAMILRSHVFIQAVPGSLLSILLDVDLAVSSEEKRGSFERVLLPQHFRPAESLLRSLWVDYWGETNCWQDLLLPCLFRSPEKLPWLP